MAKALARDLVRYLATAWRHQRDVEELPPDAGRLRAQIHRIARLNDGEALRWRQIVNVLSGARSA